MVYLNRLLVRLGELLLSVAPANKAYRASAMNTLTISAPSVVVSEAQGAGQGYHAIPR